MRKLLGVILWITATPAMAAWTGNLDLATPPIGYVMRDGYNGQWRGGYLKRVFSLQQDAREIVYVGYVHTWNAERGNSAIGLSLGHRVTLSQLVNAQPVDLTGLSVPPFLQYLGNVTSVDVTGGYMPAHTADVRGPFIWGVGFGVDLSDVFQVLSKGL